MRTDIIKTLLIFGLSLALLSCRESNIPFDKNVWNEDVDGKTCSPLRVRMLDDLLSNHKIKGLSYRQIVAKIGPPDMNTLSEGRYIRYELTEDNTWGDIVHIQDLNFYLTDDSIVDSWKIVKYDVDL